MLFPRNVQCSRHPYESRRNIWSRTVLAVCIRTLETRYDVKLNSKLHPHIVVGCDTPILARQGCFLVLRHTPKCSVCVTFQSIDLIGSSPIESESSVGGDTAAEDEAWTESLVAKAEGGSGSLESEVGMRARMVLVIMNP